jgi:pyruvate-formate lyase
VESTTLSYQQRIDQLRETKLQQTREKQAVLGAMNHDDWALVLPPPDLREIVDAVSGSGEPIKDCIYKGWQPTSNHPSGGFFGPRAVGDNYRDFLEHHPVYIDPVSALAGAYMFNFMSYRQPRWNPDYDYSHLKPAQEQYKLIHGIGGSQHFCPDLKIGLDLGWQALLEKIRSYRQLNKPHGHDFYHGIGSVVHGVQNWIQRHAEAARAMAADEPDPMLSRNLAEMAEINAHLVTEPPRTFREACQWILWYLMTARMFNGSGALGRLDVLLTPYYEQDVAAGRLTDDEAIFHIACLLLRDTAYIQLGGPDASGCDVTNRVSYLVLEAGHCLGIPANIGVSVGQGIDPGLLRRGVEIMMADKQGYPKFLGSDHVIAGTTKNGIAPEVARERAYAGCHWSAIPGREYSLMDIVKINFGAVFDVALRDLLAGAAVPPTMDSLWARFAQHLERAVGVIAQGLDFHMAHMHDVFPELVLDLCSHGPIEKGLDASQGGVEFYLLGVDGSALATVADSFAAIEQRVVQEKRMTWEALLHHLDTDWAGPDGEKARLMIASVPRYGHGSTRADVYAERISQTFSRLVTAKPTPDGFRMVPGIFSWALTISMGSSLGATPNGRHAGEPISHGANPHPGFRKDGAPTALAVAVAAVQPGYGNTAPLQLDLEPSLAQDESAAAQVASLIRTHFELGGTQINMNVLDTQQLLEAYEDPSKYPDLVVRVTGFSAYFASLSPEFRKMVIDRVIAAEMA